MSIWTPPNELAEYVDWTNPVNWDHDLNRGLVSWWLAVEGGGYGSNRWLDLCNRHHGTLTNMDPASDWVGPRGGPGWGALDFDGADDYVATSLQQITGNSPRTHLVILRTRDIASDKKFIGGSTNSATGGRNYDWTTEGGIRLRHQGGNRTWGSIVANAWYVVQMTVPDGATSTSDVRVAINGVDQGNGTLTGGSNQTLDTAANDLWIGRFVAAAASFDGQIACVMVWSRSLYGRERVLYQEAVQHFPGLLNRPTFARYAVADAGGGNNELAGWYYYAQL